MVGCAACQTLPLPAACGGRRRGSTHPGGRAVGRGRRRGPTRLAAASSSCRCRRSPPRSATTSAAAHSLPEGAARPPLRPRPPPPSPAPPPATGGVVGGRFGGTPLPHPQRPSPSPCMQSPPPTQLPPPAGGEVQCSRCCGRTVTSRRQRLVPPHPPLAPIFPRQSFVERGCLPPAGWLRQASGNEKQTYTTSLPSPQRFRGQSDWPAGGVCHCPHSQACGIARLLVITPQPATTAILLFSHERTAV